MRKSVLSNREKAVVNQLRADGYTIKAVANMFGVSKDVVVDADPLRDAYIRGRNAAISRMNRQMKVTK